MGKTPDDKRLVIVAYPPVSEWPELDELAEKGHTIIRVYDLDYKQFDLPAADLTLGPNCWRMTEELRTYLPLAIKNARDKKGKK